ncbi:hypothetical protein MTR_0001s0100 [Medicago truncatula]|uniref:Uncharacterized protein n=1 Tax=Medicago truncatula TaxID=3880 RepID=A0A072TW51_MEDTR|nr:hypothetical protein MTR_0001s0100 [Medicago truncatula]
MGLILLQILFIQELFLPTLQVLKLVKLSPKVRWNARGQPVKEASQVFVSYIGVINCREVPISMEN